jgi:Golgi nucleoside diphosphatase
MGSLAAEDVGTAGCSESVTVEDGVASILEAKCNFDYLEGLLRQLVGQMVDAVKLRRALITVAEQPKTKVYVSTLSRALQFRVQSSR